MKTLLIVLTAFFAGGVTWYLGSPLLLDDVVQEELPFDIAAQPAKDQEKEQEHRKMIEQIVDGDITKLPPEAAQEIMEMAEDLVEHAVMMPDEQEQAMVEEIRATFDEKMFFYTWKDSPEWREKVIEKLMTKEEVAMVKELESMQPEDLKNMGPKEKQHVKEMMEIITENMPDIPVDDPMEGATSASSAPAEIARPTVVATGQFRGADRFHKGEGSARLYRLEDGTHLLRFEEFSVTNGPALNVYLSRASDGTLGSDHLDLGKLKGNIGNQNYPVPGGTDLSVYKSVVVHCVPFNVTFATAKLN